MGQSTVNVILFLALILAAIIIATWYASVVRPTKEVIGRLADDVAAIRRHVQNACGSRVYAATYAFQSQQGTFDAEPTRFCITSGQYVQCSDALCPLAPANVTISNETLLAIGRENYSAINFAQG